MRPSAGPGGYFGWTLDAVNDCLRGGWGAATPFTLVWNDSAAGIEALRERKTGGGDAWLPALVELFEDHDVDVQLR